MIRSVNFFKFGLLAHIVFVCSAFGADVRYELENILVEAKQYTGGGAVVIDSADIEKSGARNLGEVLNYYSGIFVAGTSIQGRQEIKIRGMGDNLRNLLVVVDGRPDKMSIFSCTITQGINIENIEKIEILKGPQGVLYGSDAVGGVIKITTKKYSGQDEISLKTTYGTFNTANYMLSSRNNFGNAQSYISASKGYSDGHRRNSGYDKENYLGSLSYKLAGHSKLDLTAGYSDDFDSEPGSIYVPTYADKRSYKRFNLTAVYEYSNEYENFNLTAFDNHGHHQFYGSDNWHSKDYSAGLNSKYERLLYGTNKFTAGVDYKRLDGRRLPPQPEGRWHKNESSLYLYDSFPLAREALTLGGGLRYFVDSSAGSKLIPEAKADYNLCSSTKVSASIKKGFRAPAINELYLFPSSNPDLEAEDFVNYEAGINSRITARISFNCAMYEMKGKNIIQSVRNTGSGAPFLLRNTGEFTFKGIESGFEYADSRAQAEISYAKQDTGALTAGRPAHQIQSVINLDAGRFDYNISCKYFSQLYSYNNKVNRLNDTFTIDSKIGFKLAKNAVIFAAGKNITNEDYQLYYGYPMPGAYYEAGLEITF